MSTHLHMSITVKWYGPSTLSLDKKFGFQFLDLNLSIHKQNIFLAEMESDIFIYAPKSNCSGWLLLLKQIYVRRICKSDF